MVDDPRRRTQAVAQSAAQKSNPPSPVRRMKWTTVVAQTERNSKILTRFGVLHGVGRQDLYI
jgi:hypothetical protein